MYAHVSICAWYGQLLQKGVTYLAGVRGWCFLDDEEDNVSIPLYMRAGVFLVENKRVSKNKR